MTDPKGNDQEWIGWTCDELTPDLCEDLQVSLESVIVRGIPVQIWKYHRVMDNNNNNSKSTLLQLPIIAIHGGPAWPHNYMLPLKQQACLGRDVYFYDQAGCGKSKLPDVQRSTTTVDTVVADNFPWLLTTSYYAQEELPAIISHLGLTDYHIIGNSWGTIVSQYFALDVRPQGLASLVLSGSLSDAQLYIQSQWDDKDGSLGSLPPYVQERIKDLEAKQAYNSPEYEAITNELTTKFTCRTAPLPDCFVESANGTNNEIYVGVQGASEFTIGGVLKDFNITHRLQELTNLPVLLSHGKYDTMRLAVIDTMYQQLPLAERLYLQKSGHVSMIDQAGTMNAAISDFLDRVEASQQDNKKFVPNNNNNNPLDETTTTTTTSLCSSTIESSQSMTNLWLLSGTVLLAFLIGTLVGCRCGPQRTKRQDYEAV